MKGSSSCTDRALGVQKTKEKYGCSRGSRMTLFKHDLRSWLEFIEAIYIFYARCVVIY